MKRFLLSALTMFALCNGVVRADTVGNTVASAVDDYILPAFKEVEAKTAELADAALADCAADDRALRSAYHAAYDAWLGAAHLQIGPLEEAQFGFALMFWPDPRGKTAKALRRLIAEADPVAEDANKYATVSVAARGFTALERMLFDNVLISQGTEEYRCVLVRAITKDIALTAAALHQRWQDHHAMEFKSAGSSGNIAFPARHDAIRKLYTSLMTSLGFDAEARVGRPLGKLDRPRPRRAEAWRSGRSLRNLRISITAQRAFAAVLAKAGQANRESRIDAAFQRVLNQASNVDSPVMDVGDASSAWLQLDILKQDIVAIQVTLDATLGRDLDLFVGFNSRDGD